MGGYSAFSTSTGCINAARRAGTTAAAKATTSASTTAPPMIAGAVRFDAEQHRLTEPAQAERQRGADHPADDADAADLPEHEPANVARRRAERDADADLTQSLRDAVGEHRIQADRGQNDGKACKRR